MTTLVPSYVTRLCDQLDIDLTKMRLLVNQAQLEDGGALGRIQDAVDAVRDYAHPEEAPGLDPLSQQKVAELESQFDVGHCADFAVALAFLLSKRPDLYRENSITLVTLLAERTETDPDGFSEAVKVCLHTFVEAQHVDGTIYYLDVAGKHEPDEAITAREQRWRECVEQRDHEVVTVDPFIQEFSHRDDFWHILQEYKCKPDRIHRELAYLFIKANSTRYL